MSDDTLFRCEGCSFQTTEEWAANEHNVSHRHSLAPPGAPRRPRSIAAAAPNASAPARAPEPLDDATLAEWEKGVRWLIGGAVIDINGFVEYIVPRFDALARDWRRLHGENAELRVDLALQRGAIALDEAIKAAAERARTPAATVTREQFELLLNEYCEAGLAYQGSLGNKTAWPDIDRVDQRVAFAHAALLGVFDRLTQGTPEPATPPAGPHIADGAPEVPEIPFAAQREAELRATERPAPRPTR